MPAAEKWGEIASFDDFAQYLYLALIEIPQIPEFSQMAPCVSALFRWWHSSYFCKSVCKKRLTFHVRTVDLSRSSPSFQEFVSADFPLGMFKNYFWNTSLFVCARPGGGE